MPRSYSFDHFTAKNPQATRGLRDKEKQQVARSGPELEEEKLHYGKAHAETEEILAEKAMNAQLMELAGLDKEELAREPPRPAAQRAPPPAPRPGSTMPIGAVPADEEPPHAGLLSELAEHTGRHVRTAGLAMRDLGRAGFRLLALPLHAARLAARRLRAIRV